MSPLELLTEAGGLIANHPEVIQDLVDLFKNPNVEKNAVRAAIRAIKVAASDAAFREELGA